MTAILFIFAVLFCSGLGGLILIASVFDYFIYAVPVLIIWFLIAYAVAKHKGR